MTDGTDPLHTWIGSSSAERITVAGRDLPGEIMGRLSLTELTYLLLTRREPTDAQRRVLDAVLVSLADHGLTPSALATRLTYTGAPESVQGAVAAGLLGAGSVFLGPTGDTAQFLADALNRHGGRAGEGADGGAAAGVVTAEGVGVVTPEDVTGGVDWGDDRLRTVAHVAVAERLGEGARVPGLGHPVHRDVDPRTPRLFELATEQGLLGPHARLLQWVAVEHEAQRGRSLPINGAGAAGAVLADLGIAPRDVRGVALIARTAGLVAHLAEEAAQPLGMGLWQEVERRSRPVD